MGVNLLCGKNSLGILHLATVSCSLPRALLLNSLSSVQIVCHLDFCGRSEAVEAQALCHQRCTISSFSSLLLFFVLASQCCASSCLYSCLSTETLRLSQSYRYTSKAFVNSCSELYSCLLKKKIHLSKPAPRNTSLSFIDLVIYVIRMRDPIDFFFVFYYFFFNLFILTGD